MDRFRGRLCTRCGVSLSTSDVTDVRAYRWELDTSKPKHLPDGRGEQRILLCKQCTSLFRAWLVNPRWEYDPEAISLIDERMGNEHT